jgi:hypothetical protein
VDRTHANQTFTQFLTPKQTKFTQTNQEKQSKRNSKKKKFEKRGLIKKRKLSDFVLAILQVFLSNSLTIHMKSAFSQLKCLMETENDQLSEIILEKKGVNLLQSNKSSFPQSVLNSSCPAAIETSLLALSQPAMKSISIFLN